MIEALFRDIDGSWQAMSSAKVQLRLIGSTALMLQSDHSRATKDSDVLETNQIDEVVANQLRSLAGRGSALHRRHRIYVDIVPAALPFLPQRPVCHALPVLSATLKNFEIEVLDVVDVVVSKLKRFSPSDRVDIDAMIERNLVPHDALIERFRDAVATFEMDARAEDLPEILDHLHTVERDMLFVPATTIDLPHWL
jgi:hypothetical protein